MPKADEKIKADVPVTIFWFDPKLRLWPELEEIVSFRVMFWDVPLTMETSDPAKEASSDAGVSPAKPPGETNAGPEVMFQFEPDWMSNSPVETTLALRHVRK